MPRAAGAHIRPTSPDSGRRTHPPNLTRQRPPHTNRLEEPLRPAAGHRDPESRGRLRRPSGPLRAGQPRKARCARAQTLFAGRALENTRDTRVPRQHVGGRSPSPYHPPPHPPSPSPPAHPPSFVSADRTSSESAGCRVAASGQDPRRRVPRAPALGPRAPIGPPNHGQSTASRVSARRTAAGSVPFLRLLPRLAPYLSCAHSHS